MEELIKGDKKSGEFNECGCLDYTVRSILKRLDVLEGK